MVLDAGQLWEVAHGDCLAVMPTLAPASFDAVVTDPPYGLEFMGKDWDAPWKQGFAEYGMGDSKGRRAGPVFGSKRNPCCRACKKHKRGTKRCECAAPDFDETPATFAQSFGEWCEGWAREALRVAKPGAHLLAFGGTRTFHRLTCAIEDAGWEVRDCLSWLYGSGFPKSHNGPWGGTALKPAWEPIVLARRPLIGTVAANHAAHGTGALRIDECRIDASGRPKIVAHAEKSQNVYGHGMNGSHSEGTTDLGRWPANVVLDEAAAGMLDEQSGDAGGGFGHAGGKVDHAAFGGGMKNRGQEIGYGDSGGASRFFYTAKASRSEREQGLRGAGLQEVRVKMNNGNDADGDPVSDRLTKQARNTHPTVKPVDLMRWLVRLVTPIGGVVLDPFTGSGTTGVACHAEGLRFVGIEREAAYVEIARARIKAEAAQGTLPLAPPPSAPPARGRGEALSPTCGRAPPVEGAGEA
jgi:DNA modification methylase